MRSAWPRSVMRRRYEVTVERRMPVQRVISVGVSASWVAMRWYSAKSSPGSPAGARASSRARRSRCMASQASNSADESDIAPSTVGQLAIATTSYYMLRSRTRVTRSEGTMRRQDWAFYISAAGTVGALALAGRSPQAALVLAGTAVAATLAAKVASRRHPEPLPYSQRWMLALTHPFFPVWALRRALDPRPGQRILEIGPGTGRHALALAPALGKEGRLDVLDIQPAMIDAVAGR